MATRAVWTERVERWERSGLEVAEFARREGLQPAQLDWWRRELRASRPQRAEPRGRPARIAKPCSPAPTAPAAPAWINIALPNGGLVRLLPGVDAATLACVLAVTAELAARRARRDTCALASSASRGVRE
jgi:hypothetical protein